MSENKLGKALEEAAGLREEIVDLREQLELRKDLAKAKRLETSETNETVARNKLKIFCLQSSWRGLKSGAGGREEGSSFKFHRGSTDRCKRSGAAIRGEAEAEMKCSLQCHLLIIQT